MPASGGLESQLGIAEETTAGIAVTPIRFFEFESESITQELERVTHSGLRVGRKTLGVNNYRVGRESNTGDIEMAIVNKGKAIWLKHMLGNVVTTTPTGGTLSRSHKATVGDLANKSLTIQVGLRDDAGVARPKTIAGCKIVEWELAGSENEYPMMTLGIDGISSTFATALAAASYPVGLADYFSTDTVVKIAGVEVDCSEWSVQGSNGLADERYYLRSTTPGRKKEQLESDMREYSGSLTLAFPDLTAVNRFINNTVASVQITMTSTIIEGAIPFSLDIMLSAVEFDGSTPEVDGAGLIPIEVPFTILDNGTADGPVRITAVNDDVAA